MEICPEFWNVLIRDIKTLTKSMEKRRTRNTYQSVIVKEVAALSGLTDKQVRRVINGESRNESVLAAYMELHEGHNKLLAQVRELVPFPKR